MININVKKVQNGEIVSDRKEVSNIYATFVRYKGADDTNENMDLQERLRPLEDKFSEIETVDEDFVDAFENIILQETLYPDLKVVVPSDSNIKPNRIIQVWAFVDSKIRKIFSLVSSCYGSGTWMSSEKWIDTDIWKY